MHARTECRSRIDMKDHLIPVLFLHFFPGRNHQYVVNIKLVEIFLPVIDPVDILRLVHRYRTLADIHKRAQVFQFLFHLPENLFRRNAFSVHLQHSAVFFFHKKAKVCNAVVFLRFRQNVHKHLLLFRRRQRNLILDLRALQPDIIQCADNNILRFRQRFDFKFYPFHERSYSS